MQDYELKSDDDYGLNMPKMRKPVMQSNFVIQKQSKNIKSIPKLGMGSTDLEILNDQSENLFDRSFDSDPYAADVKRVKDNKKRKNLGNQSPPSLEPDLSAQPSNSLSVSEQRR